VSVAEAKGLVRGDVAIPAPHAHGYNPELDGAEAELLGRIEWIESPLAPDDDP
jgi:hypothetical protein